MCVNRCLLKLKMTDRFLFGVVYLPHGNVDVFENIHSELFSRYTNIIVMGDYNCNLFDINKSSTMRSICNRLNFTISHNFLPTHFDIAHNSTSLIDYIFSSNSSKLYFLY